MGWSQRVCKETRAGTRRGEGHKRRGGLLASRGRFAAPIHRKSAYHCRWGAEKAMRSGATGQSAGGKKHRRSRGGRAEAKPGGNSVKWAAGACYSARNPAGSPREGSPEIVKSGAIGTNAALSRLISAVGIVDRSQTNKR